MLIIWLLPDLVYYLRTSSQGWRIVLATPMLLTTCILVGLLFATSPAPGLERCIGVNLASGGFSEEVQLGRQLMEESRTNEHGLQIYAMPSIRTGAVFSVDYLNSISSGKPPVLRFAFANDWSRAPGVRFEDIVHADYLFFEGGKRPISPFKIETFDHEISAYHGWLDSLSEQQGVIRVKTGPLNVLRVQNMRKLQSAFGQYAYPADSGSRHFL